MDYAKANPKKLTVGVVSPMGSAHLGALGLEKAAGVEFAIVNLGSGAKQVTNLLGGHVDTVVAGVDIMMPQVKAGEVRGLATVSDRESRFVPSVKTAQSLGHNVRTTPTQGTAVLATTPKEIVSILSKAIGQVLETSETKEKFDAAGIEMLYMGAEQYLPFLGEEEKRTKELLELAAAKPLQ